MSDKLELFNRTLTEWDEFRKWCEDRRGPSVVAKDLALFVELFRETQQRIRHEELLRAVKEAGTGQSMAGRMAPDTRDGMRSR